jgi:hypothetical protein
MDDGPKRSIVYGPSSMVWIFCLTHIADLKYSPRRPSWFKRSKNSFFFGGSRMSEMSNREKLEEAGIIKPDLTQEQYDAIEDLSSEEVDQIISVNNKLNTAITSNDTVLEMPGVVSNGSPQEQKE